jgi:hypothetical protein
MWLQHVGELIQDEGRIGTFGLFAGGHDVLEEFLGLQEIAEVFHAQLAHGLQVGLRGPWCFGLIWS